MEKDKSHASKSKDTTIDKEDLESKIVSKVPSLKAINVVPIMGISLAAVSSPAGVSAFGALALLGYGIKNNVLLDNDIDISQHTEGLQTKGDSRK